MDWQALAIGSVPVAVGVLLGVQALKVFGWASGENAPKAALGIALVLGLGAAAHQLFPVAAPYIELAYTVLVGALVAGLFYEYVAEPILSKFGVKVSSEDFE